MYEQSVHAVNVRNSELLAAGCQTTPALSGGYFRYRASITAASLSAK
jgi:hypothetical protein